MDQKGALLLETTKNDRKYTLVLPLQAPYGEAYDFCFECLNTILEMAKNATEQAKPKPEIKADKEEADD